MTGARDSEAHTQALVRGGGHPAARITGPMQAALVVGLIAFVIGVGVPLLAMAWVAVTLALIAAAGTTLLHTGGLDPEAIRPAMALGAGIAVYLLLGAWQARAAAAKGAQARDAGGGDDAGDAWARHNPVWYRATWLMVVAALSSLVASQRAGGLASSVATTAVLATACFLVVVSLVVVRRIFDRVWEGLYHIGSRGPYPAGLLTGVLLLLGGAGIWAHREGLSRVPWRELRAELELAKVDRPHGAFDAGVKALCLGAGETERTRALAAPACKFLPRANGGARAGGGASADDECFTSLMPAVPVAKGVLRRDYQLSSFDADDVAMTALLATCTATVPREKRRAYFFQVARNQGSRQIRYARRHVSCAQLAEDGVAAQLACDVRDDDDERASKLALLWESALCQFDATTAGVIRSRLVDDLPFRDVALRWRMSEATARNTFHNAIKKLRRLGFGACFRE